VPCSDGRGQVEVKEKGIYNKALKSFARANRKAMTKGEVIVWFYLKGKQLESAKFRRQVPIDNYIVDFYCSELKLAVEILGFTHTMADVIDKDESRKIVLESKGISVLEIDDREVFDDIENVIREIKGRILELRKTLPAYGTPSVGGDE
jgi:very-short-patch-repair endonuclease